MAVGQLIQPLVQVKWGDLDLTEYKSEKFPLARIQPVFSGVTIQIPEKDNAPTCEFDFSPSPIGFEAFLKCKNELVDQPVIVSIGYDGGVIFKMKFFFTGLTFTTGLEMGAKVFLVAATKGAYTDNRISFTMEKPMKLADFPKFLQDKSGEGAADLDIRFVGELKEDANTIQVQVNAIAQTPMQILQQLALAQGWKIETSDGMMEGNPIILNYSATLASNLEKDKPIVLTTQKAPKPAERKVYILGPGLLQTYTREQKFVSGVQGWDVGSSYKEPAGFEQDNSDVMTPKPKTSEKISKYENKKGGTAGYNRGKTPGQTSTKTKAKKEKEAKDKKEKETTTTASTELFMVPYVVGLKPRDFIAIPSLNYEDMYIEDWVVDQVTYKQGDGGGVVVSVQAKRDDPGGENILDAASLKAVEDQVKTLLTTKDWHNMYWSVVPPE